VPASSRTMGFHSTHGAERAAKIYTKVYNAIERNYARHWHRVVPCGFRMAGAWHEELHLVLAPHRGAFVRLPDGFPFQKATLMLVRNSRQVISKSSEKGNKCLPARGLAYFVQNC